MALLNGQRGKIFLILVIIGVFFPRSISLTPVYSRVNRGQRLQRTANAMVKRGQWPQAKKLLETHIYDFHNVPLGNTEKKKDEYCCVAYSYLLLALHCQREGNIEAARAAFREGAERFEETAHEIGCSDCRRAAARLYQSWGLLESKQGYSARAYVLVRRAVRLDDRNAPVLRWHIWARLQPSGYKWPDIIDERVLSRTFRLVKPYADLGNFVGTER